MGFRNGDGDVNHDAIFSPEGATVVRVEESPIQFRSATAAEVRGRTTLAELEEYGENVTMTANTGSSFAADQIRSTSNFKRV